MSGGREPAHVGANLRQDDPRRQHVDARDRESGAQSGFELKGPTGLHLLIHPGDERGNVPIDVLDRRIRELDVLQVEVQQEAMMVRHPAAERLAQFLGRSLIRRSARAASFTESVSPAIRARIIARPLLRQCQ